MPISGGFYEVTPVRGDPWVGWVYVSPRTGQATIRLPGVLGSVEIDGRFLGRNTLSGPIQSPEGVA